MKKITYLFTALFLVAFSWQGMAQTFPGGTGAVPDNSCPTETNYIATVSGVGTLGTTNQFDQVEITISHTWGSDLQVWLSAPGGTQVELTTGNGGNGTQYVNTIFRADAAASITTGSGDFTGTWLPEGNLADFDGLAADGDWTLDVCDGASGDTGSVDLFEITFAPVPSCLPPTNLTLDSKTSTTADISWTDGGTSVDFEYEVVDITAGGTPTGSGILTGGPTTASLVGLAADNDYVFYVRANCGLGDSTWSTLAFFTGYCASVPTSNDANGISNVQLGATDFPTGDVTYFDHTATVVDIAQSTVANLQITFETGYSYDTNVWIDFNDNLVFEALEQVFDGASTDTNPTTLDASFTVDGAAALGNHTMRIGTADTGQEPGDPCYNGTYGVTLDFKVNVTAPPSCLPPTNLTVTNVNAAAGTADLGWTDANAPSFDFTYSVEDITNGVNFIPNTSSGGATSVGITGLVSGNDYTFSVFANCGLGTSTTTGPLAWNQTDLPTCVALVSPTNGETEVVGGITPLIWTENNPIVATGYDIYFGQTSGALINLGNVPSAGIPGANMGVNITGVLSNTTYYWSIVPVNAGGTPTGGCIEFSFTTAAIPNAPIVGVTCPGLDNLDIITEEFDAQGSWTGDIGGGTANWMFGQSGPTGSSNTGPFAAHSGGAYMFYEASGATTAALAVSPAVDLTQATDGAELSFYMHAYGAGMGRLDVGVGTSPGGPFTTEFSWGGQLQTADTDAWEPIGVNLDAYVGQTIYISFSHTGINNFEGDMAIDLMNVETCLTITCPAPINLAVTNIDTIDVDISWDVEPSALTYDWEIQPAGNAQGDPGVIASDVNEASNSVANVAGPFPAASNFTLYVKSNCASGGSSYSSVAFSTPIPGDDCSNVVDLGALVSPLNSTTVGASHDYDEDCLNTTAPDLVYSILVQDGYTLDIGQTTNGYDSVYRIAYGGACPGTTLINCTDDPEFDVRSWTNNTGGDETVYWVQSGYSSNSGTFELAWTLTAPPTCIEPVNLMVTDINPTNVDLSWDEELGATDGYRWEIQDQGVPQGDPGVINSGYNSVGSTDTSVTDATGPFTIGNTYTLYVNSVCINGVDESTYASVDFSIPFNGNCGLFSSTPGTDIINTLPPTVDVITGDAPAGDVLTDLNVYVGITHTYIGDLTITITSPSGTSVDIFTGCGSEDNIDIEFDDAAGGAIVCGVGGVYLPDNALSAFNGETFAGDWSISITDCCGGDDGILDQWCLIPTTAPNPACTGTVKTWNGTDWGNLIPPPNNTDIVIIDGGYNTATVGSNIEACTLRINPTHDIIIESGDYVRVESNVEVAGNLIVLNEGSFVQVDDAAATVKIGAGFIDIQKTTPAALRDVDFSILGSPMTGETREGVYTAAAVVRNHVTGNFSPNLDVEIVSPGINNWADDNGDNWLPHTGLLVPGTGYLVKPQFDGGGPDAVYQTNYTLGTLNNGLISVPTIFNIVGTAQENQNASPNILSNPYASAIDAAVLIGLLANADMGGTLYFWEHITNPVGQGYPGYVTDNYNMGDISMYSLGGGIAAANAGGGAQPSNQFVASGQGFGIKVTLDSPVTFNNSMRITGLNTGYRNSDAAIDRVYIQLNNDTYSLASSALIAFTENATNEFDQNYDTTRLATPISIYSYNNDTELTIQGRSIFTEDQIVPLGFSTLVDENQTYTISLGVIEGELISNAIVFLKDNLLNTVTNLSETDYMFTANMGNQQDRFVLVFERGILGNQEVSLEAVSIYPVPTASLLTINSPLAKVNTVAIHDISGRQVAFYNFTSQNSYQMDVTSLESAVYFVEINTDNGSVTRRIIKE